MADLPSTDDEDEDFIPVIKNKAKAKAKQAPTTPRAKSSGAPQPKGTPDKSAGPIRTTRKRSRSSPLEAGKKEQAVDLLADTPEEEARGVRAADLAARFAPLAACRESAEAPQAVDAAIAALGAPPSFASTAGSSSSTSRAPSPGSGRAVSPPPPDARVNDIADTVTRHVDELAAALAREGIAPGALDE